MPLPAFELSRPPAHPAAPRAVGPELRFAVENPMDVSTFIRRAGDLRAVPLGRSSRRLAEASGAQIVSSAKADQLGWL